MPKPVIHIKRVYDPVDSKDGLRILVDRLWPRGCSKSHLALFEWVKDIAPSTALRLWFNHDSGKWEEFKKRYQTELGHEPAASCVEKLLEILHQHSVTLLYSAKDTEHNQAVVLQDFLQEKMKKA